VNRNKQTSSISCGYYSKYHWSAFIFTGST